MTQHRSNIVFDTEATGSVFVVREKEAPLFFFEGEDDAKSRGVCRFALRMYDLGQEHKSGEVRKVLGIR